jgi:hypothetical protein
LLQTARSHHWPAGDGVASGQSRFGRGACSPTGRLKRTSCIIKLHYCCTSSCNSSRMVVVPRLAYVHVRCTGNHCLNAASLFLIVSFFPLPRLPRKRKGKGCGRTTASHHAISPSSLSFAQLFFLSPSLPCPCTHTPSLPSLPPPDPRVEAFLVGVGAKLGWSTELGPPEATVPFVSGLPYAFMMADALRRRGGRPCFSVPQE